MVAAPALAAILGDRGPQGRATLPPALLLHGPRGIGKHALALNLAQALLCEAPRADGLACGECAGCRYAIRGQHPDLLRLELTTIDEETGELAAVDTIAIDRVRALIDFVQLTSHRQRAKVAVIAPAERLNAAAANALLKTLEEPPPLTYFVLVFGLPVAPSRDDRVALPAARGAAADGRRGARLACSAGRGRARARARRRRVARHSPHSCTRTRRFRRSAARGLPRWPNPIGFFRRCSRRASTREAGTSGRRASPTRSIGCWHGPRISPASRRAAWRDRIPMPHVRWPHLPAGWRLPHSFAIIDR